MVNNIRILPIVLAYFLMGCVTSSTNTDLKVIQDIILAYHYAKTAGQTDKTIALSTVNWASKIKHPDTESLIDEQVSATLWSKLFTLHTTPEVNKIIVEDDSAKAILLPNSGKSNIYYQYELVKQGNDWKINSEQINADSIDAVVLLDINEDSIRLHNKFLHYKDFLLVIDNATAFENECKVYLHEEFKASFLAPPNFKSHQIFGRDYFEPAEYEIRCASSDNSRRKVDEFQITE